MRCIGPHDRRNGHHVVCEVVENINVLPVVEGIRSVAVCALGEAEQQRVCDNTN